MHDKNLQNQIATRESASAFPYAQLRMKGRSRVFKMGNGRSYSPDTGCGFGAHKNLLRKGSRVWEALITSLSLAAPLLTPLHSTPGMILQVQIPWQRSILQQERIFFERTSTYSFTQYILSSCSD